MWNFLPGVMETKGCLLAPSGACSALSQEALAALSYLLGEVAGLDGGGWAFGDLQDPLGAPTRAPLGKKRERPCEDFKKTLPGVMMQRPYRHCLKICENNGF